MGKKSLWLAKLLLAVFVFLLTCGSGLGAELLPKPPDLIILNGQILTADKDDPDFTVAQAVAVLDGSIYAVGANEQIRRLAGPRTKMIDAQGKSVIPGIVDTHAHLNEYAPVRWAHLITEPAYRDFTPVQIEAASAEEAMSKVRSLIAERGPGRWVHVEIVNREVQKKLIELLTKDYMNKLGEESLLVIRTVGTTRHYNRRVFDHVMQRVGAGPQEREVFEKGTSGAAFMRFMLSDVVIRDPLRSLGPVFLKELEQWASIGVTTWSSVITPTNALSVFTELDRQGALPIRFAYTHGQGIVAFEDAIGFYRRYGDIAGHGTPYFWNIGISVGAFDSSWPRMCVSLKPRKPDFRQQCDAEPSDHRRKVLEAAIAARLRLGGNHAEGDLAVDHALDAIEAGSKAGGLRPDEIRAKQHVIDHCAFNPRPDQIKRSVPLGIIWSCGPRYIDDRASLVADMFGEDSAHNWVVPARSILKAGGKLVYESDDEELIKRGPFYHLERFVTRKDAKGRVWGAHEALDRRTALLTATRWAARYVLREDVIGSVEAGKWADIVMLDGDFLAVANNDISKLRVDATFVGGKLVYASDAFALKNRMSPRVREIDLLYRKELLERR